MSEPPADPLEELDQTQPEEQAPFALVAQFFLIPLAVVVIAVSIFFFFGLLSREKHSPGEYLQEIEKGSASRRKLAAFELATMLGTKPELVADDELFAKTLRIFSTSTEPEVRRYLSLALGRFARKDAVDALLTALDDSDEETRLNSVVALSSIGDRRASPRLIGLLGGEETSLRKAAAYALGHLREEEAIPGLLVAAEDRFFDVALQASLALAQLGDGRGLPALRIAIDRQLLAARLDMKPPQLDENLINAIRGITLLRDAESVPGLRAMAVADPSLRVRDAAIRAIEIIEAPAPSSISP